MDNNLEKRIQKYTNMKQNQGKSKEEIAALAQQSIDEENLVNGLSFCIGEEKEFATELLNKYLSQSSFENESDKQILKQLIDQHLLAERFKKIMNTEYVKANPIQSVDMVEQLDKIVDRIVKLQEKLGLTTKDKQQNTWITHWKQLEKKCLNYYNSHAGETYTRCPKCNASYRLLMKASDKEKFPATFFQGTKVYNKKLFSLYHDKKLTAFDLAEILGVSIQYIDDIYNELFLKEPKND